MTGARLVLWAVSAMLLTSAGCATGTRGYPAWGGIPNLDCVDENLYRGAQPTIVGMETLANLGIKTIINLRQTNDVAVWEIPAAARLGMTYTNVPMHGLSRPTDEQVRQVLAIIETAQKPVFIHCKHGRDRTGTIIACYRIKTRNWTSAQAQKEADEHGMVPVEIGMKAFIKDFANRPPAER